MTHDSEQSELRSVQVEIIVDQKCDEFESAWQEGQTPRIEEFIDVYQEPTRSKLLRELLLLERELSPNPIDINDFLTRFPNDQPIVRDCFQRLIGIETDAGVPPSSDTRFDRFLTAGTKLGEYELIEKIGEGGMGQVFKAKHLRMKRVVALKTLPNAFAGSMELKQRFQREVEAAAQLEHSNIVTAYDAGEENQVTFLVMQFVEGEDLMSRIQQNPLTPAQAVDITIQTARGLHYAHQRGVIHRDIKPSNLLLDKTGVVKILDMGLARFDHDLDSEGHKIMELTQQGCVMGTVDYISPEQSLDARKADHRSDIYSLGCTLFHMLTGRSAFAGETITQKIFAHHNDPIPSACEVTLGLPKEIDFLLQRMLAKKVTDRFQSMAEVIEALESLGENLSELQVKVKPAGQGSFTSEQATIEGSLDQTNAEFSLPSTIVVPHSLTQKNMMVGAGFTAILLSISLVSVTLAYSSMTSELWIERYDKLSGTGLDGLGWEIESIRSIIYLPAVMVLCGWRFRREILQILGRLPGKRFALVARVLLITFSIGFGTYETHRHLFADQAPKKLVAEMGEDPNDSDLVAQQWYPHAAYLPYALINYMVVMPLLVIVPIAALGSDFPRLSEQQKAFSERLHQHKLGDQQIRASFQKFELNCQAVCARYLDFLMLLMLAINYECWIGRFTLSNAAFGLMVGGWVLVALFAIGCFLWLFAIYTEGNQSAARALVACESAECANFRNQHNPAAFLKWLLTGRLSGLAVAILTVLFFVWLFNMPDF